jgi:hypothetical protein
MSFGTGRPATANCGDRDLAGIDIFGGLDADLGVPQSYVSGNPLLGTSTYDNAIFASLGVTPGTYVWTWGAIGSPPRSCPLR